MGVEACLIVQEREPSKQLLLGRSKKKTNFAKWKKSKCRFCSYIFLFFRHGLLDRRLWSPGIAAKDQNINRSSDFKFNIDLTRAELGPSALVHHFSIVIIVDFIIIIGGALYNN